MFGGMLKEFKDFAVKGNVVDLAVGVIIGAAFGKIVSSAVSDLLMPPIGMIAGKIDFSSLFISLNGESYESLTKAKAAGAPVIAYGLFLNNTIDFLIVAFVIFMVVKQLNRLKKPPPAGPATTKDCPRCATAIPLKATRCPHCTSEITA